MMEALCELMILLFALNVEKCSTKITSLDVLKQKSRVNFMSHAIKLKVDVDTKITTKAVTLAAENNLC